MFKWKIENRYDNEGHGVSVGKGDFVSHRQAVNDLIREIESDHNQLRYGLGEKERTKTIITVEEYDGEPHVK